MEEFLKAGEFIDSENPEIREFVDGCLTSMRGDQVAKVKVLFESIRDRFPYDPYKIDLRRSQMKASSILRRKSGYCIQKAMLLAAACRVIEVPSRLRFFNVRNHLGTGNLEKALGTDLIVFHGGAEVLLNKKWVQLVPAFDSRLCERLGVEVLQFDIETGAIFQEFKSEEESVDGRRFMEYVHDYGAFADFPYELAVENLRKHYGVAFDESIPPEKRILFTHW